MKKLIPGMFSSVTDAELILATSGYDDEAPENVTDKFSDNGGDNSLPRAEINSSIVSKATANEASYRAAMEEGLDDSLR
ncbi:hypothetical protein [Sporomusa malonica]|uniref:Uncharacterized protein n=1 Tax=Sporomusa malonica TaxID=112901 RepID=A0A1W2EH83_9FIRM|nr:hypothetical protein [Sporomusa malonica]SMD09039.1 hypothetical protein SAMN04488500_12435 [Sporomusa malonica]